MADEGDNVTELLRRIQEADGPDREIDCRLHWLLVQPDKSWATITLNGRRSWAEFAYECMGNTSYTASIDAALALTEQKLPEWDYLLGRTNGGLTIHCQLGPAQENATGFGATLPLAILAALLRALKGEAT